MRWARRTLIAAVSVLVAVSLLLVVLSNMATRPTTLGHRGGQLAACPNSPNCVCSQASDETHAMPPIPFSGSAEAAMTQLVQIIEKQPRATIISHDDRYLHAEFTSLIFRFRDDVEFLIDLEEQVIHFRSASRVGRSDLGANRQRMRKITKLMSGD